MIVGLGVDTVEVKRFQSWTEHLDKIARFFHAVEVEYVQSVALRNRAASLAARFAAKEAFGKATRRGLRDVRMRDIAVTHEADSSAPQLVLFNNAKKIVDNIGMCHIHLSLTHTDLYATACVIIECYE